MAEPDYHAEAVLAQEFEYARETAAQAQSDRTAVANLYVILVGGVGVVGIGLPQFLPARTGDFPSSHYILLFLGLALIGFFTLMKLVRLRQAWCESVRAMNTIKQFYLTRFPDLESAFVWKPRAAPPSNKPWTITFNLALLVVILDSLALAVAVHLTGWRVPLNDYAIDAFAAAVFFCWQLFYFFYQLS